MVPLDLRTLVCAEPSYQILIVTMSLMACTRVGTEHRRVGLGWGLWGTQLADSTPDQDPNTMKFRPRRKSIFQYFLYDLSEISLACDFRMCFQSRIYLVPNQNVLSAVV